jgi:hypothetical protein
LLRVRLAAYYSGIVALDEIAAQEEANRAASYHYQSGSNQSGSNDPRLAGSNDPRLDGGYWFGRKRGEMLPFMNPVSTAFCMQALEMWEQHRAGAWRFELRELI